MTFLRDLQEIPPLGWLAITGVLILISLVVLGIGLAII
jgi:hypothetical protein